MLSLNATAFCTTFQILTLNSHLITSNSSESNLCSFLKRDYLETATITIFSNSSLNPENIWNIRVKKFSPFSQTYFVTVENLGEVLNLLQKVDVSHKIGHNFVFRLEFIPANLDFAMLFKFNANIYFYLTRSHDLYELCYFCETALIHVEGLILSENWKRPLNFKGWPIHTEGHPNDLCQAEFRFMNCHFTYRFYSAAQKKFNFTFSWIFSYGQMLVHLRGGTHACSRSFIQYILNYLIIHLLFSKYFEAFH